MTMFRPLLPLAVYKDRELRELPYPLMWAPRIDGIRVVIVGNAAFSASGKRLPNQKTQDELDGDFLDGLDGELVFGPLNTPDTTRHSQSLVMARSGPGLYEAAGVFHVTEDMSDIGLPFAERYKAAGQVISGLPDQYQSIIKLVPYELVATYDDLKCILGVVTRAGYPGINCRHPQGLYRAGKSNLKAALSLNIRSIDP